VLAFDLELDEVSHSEDITWFMEHLNAGRLDEVNHLYGYDLFKKYDGYRLVWTSGREKRMMKVENLLIGDYSSCGF